MNKIFTFRQVRTLILSVLFIITGFVPLFLNADSPRDLAELIARFTSLVNPVAGLLTGLAFLAFIWGVVKYVFHAGDEKAKEEGQAIMVYGIIGLFVLFSIWAIIRFLRATIF